MKEDITIEAVFLNEFDIEVHVSYTRPIQLTSPQMYGEDVKAVQRKLNSLGYSAGTVDGYYGAKGYAAVKDFQGVNGLAVDGSVGPATWNKLFSPTAKPKPTTSGSGYSRPLSLKSPQMYGEDVRKVQNRLNTLKYSSGTADGYFGPNTDKAVKDFQKVNGLTVDGSVGPATWNKLFSPTAKPKPTTSGSVGPIVDQIMSTGKFNNLSMVVRKGGTLYNSNYVIKGTGYYGQTDQWYKNDWNTGSTREMYYGIKDGNKYVIEIKNTIDSFIPKLSDVLGIARDKVSETIWNNIKSFIDKELKKGLTLSDSLENIELSEEDLLLINNMYEKFINDPDDNRTIEEIELDKERALPSLALILSIMKGIEFFSKVYSATKTLEPFAGYAYNTLRAIHHFNKI